MREFCDQLPNEDQVTPVIYVFSNGAKIYAQWVLLTFNPLPVIWLNVMIFLWLNRCLSDGTFYPVSSYLTAGTSRVIPCVNTSYFTVYKFANHALNMWRNGVEPVLVSAHLKKKFVFEKKLSLSLTWVNSELWKEKDKAAKTRWRKSHTRITA